MKISEITYKPNRNIVVITLIVVASVMFCIAFLKTNQLSISCIIAGMTGFILFVRTYLTNHVVNIRVDSEKKILFAYTQIWNKKQVIQFSLEDIDVTFKDEIGAKGTIRPSLRIYKDDELLFDIMPGISGWSSKTLEEIKMHILHIKSYS